MAFRMSDFGEPNCRTLGDRILVIDVDSASPLESQRRIWSLYAALSKRSDVIECVPGLGNLTVLVTSQRAIPALLDEVRSAAPEEVPAPGSVVIPVRYDGIDVQTVADACGTSVEEVIRLHSGRDYVAYFLGFQPGFAYLGDLDERLAIPRRATPRARVPAGSVAIADRMTAVYPFASPGGWHLIGTTDERLFDPACEPAARIVPGDRVRFVPT